MMLDIIIYFILLAVIIGTTFLYVSQSGSGAQRLEDIYAKEIALLVDSSKPGSEIYLDVTEATKMAARDKLPVESLFSFEDNNVNVRLRNGFGVSYPYFSNVDLEGSIELASGKENAEDILHLVVKEKSNA